MKKNILLSLLLALAALTGQAQIVCHVEGELMSNKYGYNIVICEEGTDLRVNDDPSLHVKAVNGKFSKTIECDHIKKYQVFLYKEYQNGYWRSGYFFAENGTVHVKLYADQDHVVESDGEQGRLKQGLDNLLEKQFGEINELNHLIYDNEHQSEIYTADFLSSKEQLSKELQEAYSSSIRPQARIDSLHRAYKQLWSDPDRFTVKGLEVYNKREKLSNERTDFEYQYYVDHPMLESLYKTLDAIDILNDRDRYTNFNPQPYERLVALYQDKLINYFPQHPVHEKIASRLMANALQAGKHYIDYNVRNTDGQLVPISSLIKGKVALIDLWASWCGPCRRHSVAMIPVYEKYKDQGFTVIAIARETNREAMEKAIKQDGYPWPSLLELKDENQVWSKNGVPNSGGAMILVDRDGTILSTSTEVKELEPLIRKALISDTNIRR